MRKLNIGAIVIIAVILFSCQREIDWGLAPASDRLLVRITSKSPTDSSIIDFTYNSSKQLIQEATAIISAASSNNDLKITRSASGIITRTKQVNSQLQAQ